MIKKIAAAQVKIFLSPAFPETRAFIFFFFFDLR